ncbi:MAG: imidazole glycerol phosphate synthase subunit HisH [Calditrichia bacterium]
MIGIIDYSAGNLQSVKNALEYLNLHYSMIEKPEQFSKIDKLILPGVGHFGSAVTNLQQSGLWEKIQDWLIQNRPFLGICLGMQLLFETSEEAPDTKGFAIFPGELKKFETGKVPNIGWNQVSWKKQPTPLFQLSNDQYYYFVHSYYVPMTNESYVLGTSDYFMPYVSAVNKGNIYGFQFHPERSGRDGLQVLKFWGTL